MLAREDAPEPPDHGQSHGENVGSPGPISAFSLPVSFGEVDESPSSISSPGSVVSDHEDGAEDSASSAASDREDDGRKDLGRILEIAAPERPMLVVATICLFLSLVPPMYLPIAFGEMMDELVAHSKGDLTAGSDDDKRRANVDRLAVRLCLILLLGAFFSFWRSFIFNTAGERVVARLRIRLFASIMRQEIGFFDRRKSGELLSRLSSDCTSMQDVATSNLSMFLRGSAEILIAGALMFRTSWRLTLLVLLVVPFVVISIVVYGRQLRYLSRNYADALGESASCAQEAISNIKTARSFGAERMEVLRYRRAIGDPDRMSDIYNEKPLLFEERERRRSKSSGSSSTGDEGTTPRGAPGTFLRGSSSICGVRGSRTCSCVQCGNGTRGVWGV